MVVALYERDELEDIAEHGCKSGVAAQHLYDWQNLGFYFYFKDEILEELEAEPAEPDLHRMTQLVWRFIEKKAIEACQDS